MSGEVAKLEPVQTPAAPANSEGAVVLAMIDKLIARPDVPVEKLEQMFALHQKVQAEAARRAYHAGLAELQADLPTVAALGKITGEDKATGGKVLRSRYAKWEDVNEAIRPALTKHGFALSFRISQPADASRVTVTAVLSHRDGHAEETSLHLPNDPSGGKNNVQAWGSSVSYGKRYTAFALLNIVARGEDDDGEAAGNKADDASIETIKKLIEDTKSDPTWFLTHYSIETLDDLNGKQRNEIRSKLNAKLANMRKQRNG